MTLKGAAQALSAVALLVPLSGCDKLSDFDTSGDAAYCGSIVDAAFIRTAEFNGGFGHAAQMKVQIDTSKLTTTPGWLTTDDKACSGGPTFDGAEIRVQPEIVNDPLSSMTFEDGQVHNVIGWVDSCRGSTLVIVSLLKTDRVDVRLLEPRDIAGKGQDVFSLFSLRRNERGCSFESVR